MVRPTTASAAFDGVAPTYDESFTQRPLARWLRDHVRHRVAPLLRPGMHALELGCGTGEDALWLALEGVQVTAVDASSEMLGVAEAKVAGAGLDDRIRLERVDLADPQGLETLALDPLDLVFSNFGVLNCVPDRSRLAATLDRLLLRGGLVAMTVMGPWCPWEVMWYLAHGAPGTAFRRLRQSTLARLEDGAPVRIDYPSTRRLRQEFGLGFEHEATYGIGSFLPPSYVEPLTARWPGAFSRVARIDEAVAPYVPFRVLSDHYLTILRRKGQHAA